MIKTTRKKPYRYLFLMLSLIVYLFSLISSATAEEEDEESFPIGEHGGRLLIEDDVVVELLLYERGIAPVFRAWVMRQGVAVTPGEWQINVELMRLGDEEESISFIAEDDFLTSSAAIEPPHSFDVEVNARIQGVSYEWEFESHQGRIEIDSEMAKQVGIRVSQVTNGIIHQTIPLYGKITPDPQQISYVTARYPGLIKSIIPAIGDEVRAGELLLTIEANDSLRTYEILSPIDGVVIERPGNTGEVAGEQSLLTIANYQIVWANLNVFLTDSQWIKPGQVVSISMGGLSTVGSIAYLNPGKGLSAQIQAIIILDNSDMQWIPGMLVEAEVTVQEFEVPLVITNLALQDIGGEQIVFIQVGELYETRKVELGRTDGNLTEVLGGLRQGERYVVENSYLLKADLQKSLAADDD
ncbi:MAG: heavy metal resistance protein CzcB [Alphaproteobacteria bacterium]|nr:MAG: heavy metal resistance protein CzcB [Alphaproteobacteria bacterium]